MYFASGGTSSSGRKHQTSLPIFWPGFFISRTFIQAACGEEGKPNDFQHIDGGRAPGLHGLVVHKHLSQLVQGRPAITLPAFQVVAQLAQHTPGTAHGERIDLVAPGIFGDGQDSAEMRQVVASGLWLNPTTLTAHSP